METWQLQDAKNKFSALVEHALHDGPQMVTRHGKPAVVVMSALEYEAFAAGKTPAMDFKEFLLSMPKLPDEWFENGEDPFERIDGPMRDIDL
jgi:antitoxin Phd